MSATQKLHFSLQSPLENICRLYDEFSAPITALDCGQKCAIHNPTGKPYCCDICHAIPAAYTEEWKFLQQSTTLWHTWHGNEAKEIDKDDREKLIAETPENMILLACLGPKSCERKFRTLSCRQFPFFPYVTSDYRFIGMAYDWEFEQTCWVISHLQDVSIPYKEQFFETHDRLFAFSQDAFDSYHEHSTRMRTHFGNLRRRIPLLHRNGNSYLISPLSERMVKSATEKFPRFGVYREG